ncbi:ECF sigma factor [Symmachiella dynata]|uniref:ECF-type sigma factor n=1 Tax=Symmachiella dynata TaxID=2527995 RepID=UPI001189E9DB|nr:ECF-type sigma factor [Symmachiella dynata]QDT51780.1 ECF sigma factor [Symmachiella dynata]
MTNGDVTQVLEAISRGERLASEQLLPLVYDQLRKLASQKMSQEAVGHTLQPTALVHEAYLRLVADVSDSDWENRGHFYAAAAEAMRRILIEAARRKSSLKQGGDRQRIELPEEIADVNFADSDAIIALDGSLEKLQQKDPESFKLVMLRYFGGLTVDESAAAMGISPRTAKRNWSFARAWLQREINRQSE